MGGYLCRGLVFAAAAAAELLLLLLLLFLHAAPRVGCAGRLFIWGERRFVASSLLLGGIKSLIASINPSTNSNSSSSRSKAGV